MVHPVLKITRFSHTRNWNAWTWSRVPIFEYECGDTTEKTFVALLELVLTASITVSMSNFLRSSLLALGGHLTGADYRWLTVHS